LLLTSLDKRQPLWLFPPIYSRLIISRSQTLTSVPDHQTMLQVPLKFHHPIKVLTLYLQGSQSLRSTPRELMPLPRWWLMRK
jgi:hypothetical protein